MEIEKEREIRKILERFIEMFLPNLDCDGGTRFVSAMMDKMSIGHNIYYGSVTGKSGEPFIPHYWIQSKNNLMWDFKCEKWVGSKSEDCSYIVMDELDKDEFMLKHLMNREQLVTILLAVG